MISPRDVIDQGIAAVRVEHTDPPTAFWASSVGNCLRKQILKRRNVEGEPFDERSLRVFAIGDALHDWVKAVIEQAASEKGVKVLAHEVPVYDENLQLSGRIDSLVLQPDGTPEAWEFKTINSNAFHYKDLPFESHKAQVWAYLAFYKSPLELARAAELVDFDKYRELKALLPTKLTRGRLIYISKDDALIEDHVIELTPEAEDQLHERLLELHDWLGREDLPPVLPMTPEKRPDGTDFVYKVGPHKGETKMQYDYECHRPNNSKIRCSYFTQCFPQGETNAE